MEMDNIISFVQVASDQDANVFSRNLSSLLSLAAAQQQPQQQPQYNLSLFKYDKPIDPSLVPIKEFADNFKIIKSKLHDIEKVIADLEKQKSNIKAKHEEVCKTLHEFFEIPDDHDVFNFIHETAYQMTEKLQLEKYYEERANLLQHYKVAVPLLNEVKEEFFKDTSRLANCPICFEKEVSFAAYPCGHLTCDDCKKKLISTCFQCRAHVLKVIRIYPN